jgi:hypothetical protein
MRGAYPAIIVLMEKADQLTGSELHLVFESWLEVELDTMNSALRRTASGSDGSGRSRRTNRLTRRHGVDAVLCSSRARRNSSKHRGSLGKIKRTRDVILAKRRLASQTNSGGRSSLGLRWVDRSSHADIARASNRGDGADRARLLVDGVLVDALGTTSKGVGAVGARARHRALPRAGRQRAVGVRHGSSHSNDSATASAAIRMLLLRLEMLTLRGMRVEVRQELRNRSQTQAGRTRRRGGS